MIGRLFVAALLALVVAGTAALANLVQFKTTSAASFALVAHKAAASADTNNVTLSATDTTGGKLIACAMSFFTSGVPPTALTDNKGNTYTGVTALSELRFFYSLVSTTGTGHTFTTTGGVAAFPGLACVIYSDPGTPTLDAASTGTDVTAVNCASGSLTPANINELLVSAQSWDSNPGAFAVDSGFTIQDSQAFTPGAAIGVAIADLIETSIVAKNPTWSVSGGSASCKQLAFKP